MGSIGGRWYGLLVWTMGRRKGRRRSVAEASPTAHKVDLVQQGAVLLARPIRGAWGDPERADSATERPVRVSEGPGPPDHLGRLPDAGADLAAPGIHVDAEA